MNSREFSRLPQGPPYYQLIEGVLHLNPTPNLNHQVIRGTLGCQLGLACREDRLGIAMGLMMDVFLDDETVLEPDVFFIRQENLGIAQDWVRGVPDLVAEIISPETAELDLGPKRRIYEHFAFPEFWYVFPDTKSVEVVKRAGKSYQSTFLTQPEDMLRNEFLPDFSISLGELFEEWQFRRK